MAQARTDTETTAATGRPRQASSPLRLSGGSWVAALKRTPRAFFAKQMQDVAASLAYYAIFSIFPALIALVSTLSLIGPQATDPILESLEKTPTTASDLFTGVVETAADGGGGLPFLAGIVGALWAASAYAGAFGRASNRIYAVSEGRSLLRLRPMRLAVTALVLLLAGAAATAAVLTGSLARKAGDIIGLGDQAVETWDLVKWPAILAIAALVISILMYFTPNVRRPGFRWVVAGGTVSLAAWVLSSAGLIVYFAEFASFDKTYGALGGVIAFLFWLWISNIALLFGQVLNCELERERELHAGGFGAPEDVAFEPKATRTPGRRLPRLRS